MPTLARLIPAAVATALLATACGAASGDDSAQDSTAATNGDRTRTFEHALGSSDIPVAPERVVATTDQNALLPLLELGFTPVGSAGLVDEESGQQVFRRTDGFDTTGVEFVGAYGEPNAEAIAALSPDLIVGYEFDSDYATQLQAIAPFVAIQVFGRPLSQALLDFGDAVGRLEEAERLKGEYDQRIAELKTEIEQRHPDLTVSIISAETGGQFYLGDEGQAVGTVAYDLDLDRPSSQAESDRLGGTFTDAISLERVDDHDADVMLVLDYGGDAGTGGYDAATQEFLDSSLVQQLEAAQRDQLYVIDGSQTVGAAWARMNTFLDELETILLNDQLDVTGVNSR
jgi:iron complex transport system substrate-binding protein